MKLGIFLPIGSSFKDQKKSGQDKRFINYYLKKYNQHFDKVFVFSYENEKYKLPQNCFLAPNKLNINRFLYSSLLFYLNRRLIKKIDVFRVMQLTGAMPAVLCRIFFKKPFIFTYGYDYSAFARLEGQKIRPILLEFLEKTAIKFSSGVIVTNKKIQSYLKQKYPQAKFFYIPNGVDITKFKVQGLKFKDTDKNSKVKILTVGRLEKQKNLDSLIKAAALLKSKDKISLLFIGQGRLKLQLIKLAKKINVALQIIDRVPYSQIVKYYQQADIFCLPSFLEGQPKVLLEAMACGLPCLVGRYAGAEEFRKEVLLTGFKTSQIAKNLETLIKDFNLRKKLSQSARKKIEEEFNIEKLLSKEIKILREITLIDQRSFMN